MTYNTRADFMNGLRQALAGSDIADTREILVDFDQHFDEGAAAGETEAEVCEKLGDVDEIVKQYISENSEQKCAKNSEHFDPDELNVKKEGDDTAPGQQIPPNQGFSQQNGGSFNADAGNIIGLVCLDIFVLSWALPTLFGLIMGLYGVTIGFAASGVALFIASIVLMFTGVSGIITTGFAPLSVMFCGTMMCGFAGMLVIASIAATKGFINLCIAIINLHTRAFAGHNVLNKIGSAKKEAEAV